MTKVVPNVFVFFIYFQLTFGLQEKCEFNGRLVKIITSAEPPHVIIDEYMSKTPLIKQFGTYNVSNFVSGILVCLGLKLQFYTASDSVILLMFEN